MFRKYTSLFSSVKISSRARPVITQTSLLVFVLVFKVISRFESLFFKHCKISFCWEFPKLTSSTKTASLVSGMILEERPMFIAVSVLSPVSIQTWMPAFRTNSIVSGTPFCKVSSIAVAPTRKRLDSKKASAFLLLLILSTSVNSIHLSNSWNVNSLVAMHRVRNPSLAKSESSTSSSAKETCSSANKSFFTSESAPLQKTFSVLLRGSCNKTDIFLRSDVNSISSTISKMCCLPKMLIRRICPSISVFPTLMFSDFLA